MKVTLRAVSPADVDLFYVHQADPVGAAMAAFPSRSEAAHADHWRRLLADGSLLTRTIEADGQVAGNIGSWRDGDRRLVGYWLGREFWGRGIATVALRQLVAELDERPLWAYVAATNAGSIRVLEKSGFILAPEQPTHDEPDGVEERLYILR